MNVQRKFTNRLLVFMVTLRIGKMWRIGAVNSPKEGLMFTTSGKPSLISDNLLQETEGEIRANRRVPIRELHHVIPEVSKTTIHEAVIEKLGYRKLWARWVPKMLTDDHITKRMGSALKFLTRYGQERPSAVQSGPRARRFPLVSSPKETSCCVKVPRRWLGSRRSHDVVQRAGSRLLWLGDTEAGFKT